MAVGEAERCTRVKMGSVMPYVTVWERRPPSTVLLFRDVRNAFGRHQDFHKTIRGVEEP